MATFFSNLMSDETKDKRSSLNRIMAGHDDFDYRVITQIAQNRNISLSEVVRTITHQWIESNPEILQSNYGIDLREIAKDIQRESYQISLDKTIKPFEQDIINELPEFFSIVEEINIDDLAGHFEVDNKVIKKILFTHGKKIKDIGLNLILKNNIIYRKI